MNDRRIVVLISGGGSNLQALIDAVAGGRLGGQIVAVVSNKRTAYGLTRAADAGIPTAVLPSGAYLRDGRGRAAYDADLAAAVAAWSPDLIVLAGWMHILSPAFLNRFAGRVINLHPALPGAFAGTHAIERSFAALQAGTLAHAGCMVHYVIAEVDAGEPIVQARVPYHAHDTLESFAARVHRIEHQIIVLATAIALEALAQAPQRERAG